MKNSTARGALDMEGDEDTTLAAFEKSFNFLFDGAGVIARAVEDPDWGACIEIHAGGRSVRVRAMQDRLQIVQACGYGDLHVN